MQILLKQPPSRINRRMQFYHLFSKGPFFLNRPSTRKCRDIFVARKLILNRPKQSVAERTSGNFQTFCAYMHAYTYTQYNVSRVSPVYICIRTDIIPAVFDHRMRARARWTQGAHNKVYAGIRITKRTISASHRAIAPHSYFAQRLPSSSTSLAHKPGSSRAYTRYGAGSCLR